MLFFSKKRIIILSSLLTLFLAVNLHGQTRLPRLLTISPEDAKPNDQITVSAFVYNDYQSSLTFTVSFFKDEILLNDPISVFLLPQTGKLVSTKIQYPQDSSTISASITKAVDSQKKDIVALHGAIGSITTSAASEKTTESILVLESRAKKTLAALFSSIENFRLEKAKYFKNLEIEKKTNGNIFSSIRFQTDLVPDPSFENSGNNLDALRIDQKSNPFDSVTAVFARPLAYLFENKVLFYISFGLLILIVLRFLYKMFI